MTKKLLTLLGVLTLTLTLASLAEAAVIVQGTILGSDTLVGLADVRISLKENAVSGGPTHIGTDSNGFYSITALKHDTVYDFIFRHRGYWAEALSLLTPSPSSDPLNPDVIFDQSLILQVK